MDQTMRLAIKRNNTAQTLQAVKTSTPVSTSQSSRSTVVFSSEQGLRGVVTGRRFLIIIAAIPLVSIIGQPADLVLDLTTPRPDNIGHLGIPGQRFGWIEHVGQVPKLAPLPLEVTIQDLWPLSATDRDKFSGDILVRNIGKEPVVIPTSRRYMEVVKKGNHDQRTLTVWLKLTPTGPGAGNLKPTNIVLGFTVGSSSIPNSTISLAPQQSLLIRTANGSLFLGPEKWREAGLSLVTVSVVAVVSEDFLEESEYTVKNKSEDATSRNAVTLTLALTR